MRNLKEIVCLLWVMVAFEAFSQSGANTSLAALDLMPSSRSSALGSQTYAFSNRDNSLSIINPALLSSASLSSGSLNYANYVGDVNYATLFGNGKIKGTPVGGGFQYISYGKITETDETGNRTGSFSSADYIFNTLASHRIDSILTLGVNVRNMISQQNTGYWMYGLSANAGAVFEYPKKGFSTSVLVKNAGYVFKPLRVTNRPSMPWELQFAISKKLSKAPLTLMAAYENAQRFKLDNTVYNDSTFFRKVYRGVDQALLHLVVGAEVSLGKNFHIRLGYNYRRRHELKMPSRPALSGFSFGMGLKVSRFYIDLSRATYNVAGSTTMLTISTGFHKKNNPAP